MIVEGKKIDHAREKCIHTFNLLLKYVPSFFFLKKPKNKEYFPIGKRLPQ